MARSGAGTVPGGRRVLNVAVGGECKVAEGLPQPPAAFDRLPRRRAGRGDGTDGFVTLAGLGVRYVEEIRVHWYDVYMSRD